MKAAAAAALANEIGPEKLPHPEPWDRREGALKMPSSDPLAVMTTIGGLEDYRRRKRKDEQVRLFTSDASDLG